MIEGSVTAISNHHGPQLSYLRNLSIFFDFPNGQKLKSGLPQILVDRCFVKIYPWDWELDEKGRQVNLIEEPKASRL